MITTIDRPGETEYAPFYAGYVQSVPDGNVFEVLARQPDALRSRLAGLSAAQADFRPGPAEWSIKEVVGHLNDSERIFAYRALRISRGDPAPLAGFEQDDYIREANFGARTLPDLLEEFEFIRRANLLAFSGISQDASQRQGTASGYTVSVRALLYIMAGHVEHHLESLRRDYLPKL